MEIVGGGLQIGQVVHRLTELHHRLLNLPLLELFLEEGTDLLEEDIEVSVDNLIVLPKALQVADALIEELVQVQENLGHYHREGHFVPFLARLFNVPPAISRKGDIVDLTENIYLFFVWEFFLNYFYFHLELKL